MRLNSLATAITGLLLLQSAVIAEDSPPSGKETVTDEAWGYSYSCKGLEESPILGNFNIDAMTAEFQAGSEENLLKLDKSVSKQGTRESMEGLVKMMTKMGFSAGPIEETTLGGRKAFTVTIQKAGDEPIAGVYVHGDAEPGQPRWEFVCVCSGANSADQVKLAQAAIKTFTVFKEGEAPPLKADLQISKRLGFSIETVGFKGAIKVFPFALLGGREFVIGTGKEKKLSGHLAIRLENTTPADRAEAIDLIRKLKTSGTSKVVDVKELEVSGRKAARIWVEKTNSSGTSKEQDLYIWDADLVWNIVISYGGDASETAAGKAALEPALDSFKLLREPGK